MKQYEYDTIQSYYIACGCGSDEDHVDMIIEYNKALSDVTITMETTQKTDWWKSLDLWEVYDFDNEWIATIANSLLSLCKGIHHRLKITKDVWFNGYVKYYSFTMLNKQQLVNLIGILTRVVEKIDADKQE